MPRIRRGLADGLIYHVLNRGNGRQMVFHKENVKDQVNSPLLPQEGYNLVPSHNSTSLANALKILIENPELRRKMGARGREIVVDAP